MIGNTTDLITQLKILTTALEHGEKAETLAHAYRVRLVSIKAVLESTSAGHGAKLNSIAEIINSTKGL